MEEGKCVLIVDDEVSIVKGMQFALRKYPCRVLVASNGEEGLRLALSERPDVIVLDVLMPKMNGYEVCRQIKANAQTQHIPIIMFTARSKETDRRWALEAKADAYITKPFEIADVIARIREMIPLAPLQ